MEQQCDKVF